MADTDREQAGELPWFIAKDDISERIVVHEIEGAGPCIYGANAQTLAPNSAKLTLTYFNYFAAITEIPPGSLPLLDDLKAYYQLARAMKGKKAGVQRWTDVCENVLAPLENRSPIIIADTVADKRKMYETPQSAATITRLAVAQALGKIPPSYQKRIDALRQSQPRRAPSNLALNFGIDQRFNDGL